MLATAVLDIVPEDASAIAPDLAQTPMPQRKIGSAPVADDPYPKSGDEFYGYEIVEELGRGAFARVFSAREHRLANRTVVLKIAAKGSSEPLRLARLQHTNIVPIQTAFRAGPFHVVQMPFHGRQTLADVVEHVRTEVGFPAISGHVFTTVAQASTHRESKVQSHPNLPVAVPAPLEVCPTAGTDAIPPEDVHILDTHPLRILLDEMSYPSAVISILRRIADGLAHAHARDILHLDLKPQNILFGDDGQPMLLDFNLSRDRSSTDRKRVGGTWPYMSPEAIREYGKLSDERSDEQTDLFALGVIFYEMLTCRLPFAAVAMTPEGYERAIAEREKFVVDIREHNPEVPHAVEAIVAKLLAPNREERYRTVDQLREDLQRQEESRPLKYASETNLLERIGKWHQRNPGTMVRMLIVALMLGLATGAVLFFNVQSSKNALLAQERSRDFRNRLATARLDVSFPTDRPTRQEGMLVLAELLKSYRVGEMPDGKIADGLQHLDGAHRVAHLGHLREAALLLAHGEWMEARTQSGTECDATRDRAQHWNKLAESILPERLPASLWHQRQEIAKLRNDPSQPMAALPDGVKHDETSTEDLYLRAVAQVGRGEIHAAIETATKLTLLAPDHYAGHGLLGLCYHTTGQSQLALERYLIARPLAKAGKMALMNRAVLLNHLRKYDTAEADLNSLLAIAPQDHRALSLRGTVRQQQGKYREAIEDFTAALANGGPAICLYTGRADCYDKTEESQLAAADRALAAGRKPTTPEDYTLLGNKLAHTEPTEALEKFNAALKLNPEYLPAYHNKSYVLAERLGEWELALEVQDRIRKVSPSYVPGMASRAVLLARLGKRDEALREMENALARSKDGPILFRAACVQSLLANDSADARQKALKYLRQAVREGYRNVAEMEKDPDLKSLGNEAEFLAIVQLARDIAK